jgi:hypothetical protein
LNITDSNVYVANAAALTPPSITTLTPGTVFINGEKINFWGIDLQNNILLNIRRAVDGTGAPMTHTIGSQLVDTNTPQLFPTSTSANVYTTTWLNGKIGAPEQIVLTDSSHNQYDWIEETTGTGGNDVFLETIGASANAVTDGSGLQGSTSPQALFLKRLT